MDDLISRQAAIDAIGEKSDEIYKTKQKGATYPHDDFFQGMAYAENVIEQLPSVQPTQNDRVNSNNPLDCISRAAAIKEFSCCELTPDGGIDVNYAIDFLNQLPSVQPDLSEYSDKLWRNAYERGKTEAEIQKMQDLEQAEIQKAYELGKLDAMDEMPQWIPCSERLPETHKTGNSVSGIFMQSKPVLVYGVPEYESEYSFNVVTYCDDLNGITYWSTEMDAVTINKVTAWMPLPEPYEEDKE